jgi:hypothetical protein
MIRKNPSSISEILSSKLGKMSNLIKEINRHNKITIKIKELLPKEDAAHLVDANISKDGTLVLLVDSSEWAARIRYIAPDLVKKKIIVKVLPQKN